MTVSLGKNTKNYSASTMLNKMTLQEQKQGFDSYVHQLQNRECYTAALLVGPLFW